MNRTARAAARKLDTLLHIARRFSPVRLFRRRRLLKAVSESEPFVGGFGHGIRLWVEPSMFVGHMYEMGSYERHVVAFLKKTVQPGAHCIDIGANVGFFTVLLAQLVGERGRVTAFEPTPDTARLLARNVELNGLINVRIVQTAVGADAGDLTLQVGEPGYEVYNTAGDVRHPAALKGQFRKIIVPCTTADRWAEQNDVDHIHLVKIDVEGGEMDVLRGMSAILGAHRPILVIEFSDITSGSFGRSVASMVNLLRGRDYEVGVIGPFGTLRPPKVDEAWKGQMVAARPVAPQQ